MCSYNRINNTYACENNQTLNVDLKGIMGFKVRSPALLRREISMVPLSRLPWKGFVMSDWGATHSTIQAANSGLDMEMPDDTYFGSVSVS
jgi:beta-glucosidase